MARKDEEDIELAGGLDAREESPYLRRSKAVSVRRGRFPRRFRRIALGTFVALLVLLPAGVTGYALARYALGSPRFLLSSPSDVTVTGNHYVSRADILNAIGIPASPGLEAGFNIFRMSLDREAKLVATIPWIETARVVRAFPHRLAINVKERTPIAFADVGGRIKLVDAEGVILDKPDNSSFDFPVLKGLDADDSADGRKIRVALYQEFTRETADEIPRSGWMVSEADLSDPDDLQALLVQGRETLLVHFGQQDFLGRFKNFLTLLPQLEKNNAKIDSVDLRYRNQVVVDPAEPEQTKAAPSPRRPSRAGKVRD